MSYCVWLLGGKWRKLSHSSKRSVVAAHAAGFGKVSCCFLVSDILHLLLVYSPKADEVNQFQCYFALRKCLY